MSALTLCLIIFGAMLVLMAIRVPIAVSMFSAGTLGYLIQTGWGPYSSFLNNLAFARFASYDLSVIPLFILMGHFATQGGISKALFQFAASVMGRFKGGLAMAAVLASAAFGSICGSSVATAALPCLGPRVAMAMPGSFCRSTSLSFQVCPVRRQ
jgi:C4-dicarboxylate transporter DctM subunit